MREKRVRADEGKALGPQDSALLRKAGHRSDMLSWRTAGDLLGMLVVVLLSGIILYLNFKRLAFRVDTDYIAELDYGRLVWEQKDLFPDEWVYANELMFFRPASLAALFYGLSGNYLLSYSFALTVNLLLFLFSAWYFLKSFKLKNGSVFLALALLLSFGGVDRNLVDGIRGIFDGHDRNFLVLTLLYYGYYCFYLVSVFLTVGYLERQRGQVPGGG